MKEENETQNNVMSLKLAETIAGGMEMSAGKTSSFQPAWINCYFFFGVGEGVG